MVGSQIAISCGRRLLDHNEWGQQLQGHDLVELIVVRVYIYIYIYIFVFFLIWDLFGFEV